MDKRSAKQLIPLGVLYAYVRSVLPAPLASGESLVDAVAQSISVAHAIPRGSMSGRKFVEQHRALVYLASRGAAQPIMRPATTSPSRADAVLRIAASDAFLQSFEWRRVRMQALKKYGAKCQCCGATPANGAVMNVDHVKPRKLFPELALTLENLQVLCADCNHGNGNWDMTDWRAPQTSLEPPS